MKLGRKGFTLVELVVVIIIVGVLAAVALPLMTANITKAKNSEAMAGLGTIRTAERLYYVQNNSTYATNLAGLNSFIGPTDLNGKYFNQSDYNVDAAGNASCTALYGTGKIYLNVDGSSSGY